MSLIAKKYINGLSSRFVEPNTFIGGVGFSTVENTSELAGNFNLTASEIKNFIVDSFGNVSCHIVSTYSTLSYLNCFKQDDNITYYIDTAELMSFNGAFVECENLKYLYAPNANLINKEQTLTQKGANDSALLKINIEGTTVINSMHLLKLANRLKKLYLPNVLEISYNGRLNPFNNMSRLEKLYIANISIYPSDFTRYSLIANTLYLPFFKIGIGCKIYYNSVLGVQDRNAFNNSTRGNWHVGDSLTINGLVYTAVDTTPNEGEFNVVGGNANTWQSRLKNAINSDTRIGTYSKVLADNANSALVLYVEDAGVDGNNVTAFVNPANTGTGNISHLNFKGGYDVHPSLVRARDDRGAVLIECSAPIPVNPPTLLSLSNLTTNSIDLNFTPPPPNANGTECFEVWVDDGTVYRKLFEYAEITASGDTLDLTEVLADVGSLIGVQVCLRTMDGQMNYSEFTDWETIE